MELLERLRAGGEPAVRILTDLAEGMTASGRPGKAATLLVVDQWEELLGPAASEKSEQERAAFHASLRGALEATGSTLLALATVRSDFLDAFQNHPTWRGYKWELLDLSPMPPERFPCIIETPAARAGLSFEPGLAARLARDAGEANVLPLLAFTLRELWERCKDRSAMTLDVYEHQVGGIRGAVAHAVHIAIGSDLSGDDEDALRRAFLGYLVGIDDRGRYLRRRARWDDLPEPARPWLERFISSRLLSTDGVGPQRLRRGRARDPLPGMGPSQDLAG